MSVPPFHRADATTTHRPRSSPRRTLTRVRVITGCDGGGVTPSAARAALAVATGLCLFATAACAPDLTSQASSTSTARPAPAGSPTSPPSARTGSSVLSPAAALTALNTLPVLPKQPYVPGYQRSCDRGDACTFGVAWAGDPHAECNTRQLLLRSTLTDVVMRPGSACTVASGHLADPYTGTELTYSSDDPDAIEIDHAVPLLVAFTLGADKWTQAQRVAFANNRSIELVAVDRASNQAKQAMTPAQWMPPDRASWCTYDARWVTVLHAYRLPVLAADKTAITAVLQSCS